MRIEPFQVSIPQEILGDLRERLERTRWPDEVQESGWRYGANLGYIKELAEYWRTNFDWRAQEKRINSFANYRAVIGDLHIHFVHDRGKGPNPMPLLITHGWPSCFVEMLDMIPMLTDPVKYGGDASDSFDVIVPSVPGYGFSDRPLQAGMTRWRVAEIWAKLMDGLGYEEFGMQANDIGAVISGWLAMDHPEKVIGLQTMMTRRDVNGAEIWREEAVSLDEALRAYTLNGAYASFEETIKGRLAPGMLGDVTVFETDLRSVAPDEIGGVQIDYTIAEGSIAYARA